MTLLSKKRWREGERDVLREGGGERGGERGTYMRRGVIGGSYPLSGPVCGGACVRSYTTRGMPVCGRILPVVGVASVPHDPPGRDPPGPPGPSGGSLGLWGGSLPGVPVLRCGVPLCPSCLGSGGSLSPFGLGLPCCPGFPLALSPFGLGLPCCPGFPLASR